MTRLQAKAEHVPFTARGLAPVALEHALGGIWVYEAVESDSLRAQEAYRRLLARDPDSLRFAEFADLLRRLGQLEEAKEVCSSGLARHPHYSTGHVVLGEVFYDAGQFAEAEAEWQLALQFDPGHPRAHLRLGDLYLSRAETERAAAAFEAVLLYCPESLEARNRLVKVRGEKPTALPPKKKQLARQPGERPDWLTEYRCHELLETLRRDEIVESVALLDAKGEMYSPDAILSDSISGQPIASFTRDVKDLLSRLGAGRLRAALLVGEKTSLRCVPLGDLLLVAGPKLGVKYYDFAQHMDEALADPGDPLEVNAHG